MPTYLRDPLVDDIFAHYKKKGQAEPQRPHLGASLLGEACERKIHMSWKWADIPNFEGRLFRLFDRGHREEPWLIEDLQNTGIEIVGTQIPIPPFEGHGGGTCDILAKGFKQSPAKVHVVDGKTASDWSFKKIVKEGVLKSKPVYYAQLQIYMFQLFPIYGCDRAMLIVVNKNNDDIHTERLKLDVDYVEALKEKLRRIRDTNRIPGRLSPSNSECKFCHFSEACYNDNFTPQVNCRTCIHSTARPDGTWHCLKLNASIDEAVQRVGCPLHLFHPDLMNYGDPIQASEEEVHYRDNGGVLVINEKGGKIRRRK